MSDPWAEIDADLAKAKRADDSDPWAGINADLDAAKAKPVDQMQANMPYLDVGAQIQENLQGMKERADAGDRPPMPGDQPRAFSEGDPKAREIAIESSAASAANAETPEHKATREFNAFMAGAKDAIPFYPRMAGLWRAKYELARQALQKATGRSDLSAGEIWEEIKRANAEQFVQTSEEIDKDIAGSPVHAAMGAIPVMVATPGGIPAKTATGRVAGGTALGGLYGASAADRPGVTPEELAKGAAMGAGIGAVGAGLGEALRPIVRGAPAREDRAFVRELSRLEGGEGGSGLLAAQKEAIVKDLDDVIAQRADPVIRAAAKMKEGRGIPYVVAKIKPLAAENKKLYSVLDDELGKVVVVGRGSLGTPLHGARTMTAERLKQEIEAAKDALTPEAAKRLGVIKKDVDHWFKGGGKIKTGALREWLTSVQDSAGRMPGSLNATKSYEAVQEATRAAARIVNRHFDSAAQWTQGTAVPAALMRIRRNNEQISALSRIQDAMVVKAKKEHLQQIGLGNLAEEQQRRFERTAALWSAFEGKPFTAAAIAAKPYVEKGARRTLKWLDQSVLEPMQIAAEQGATKAQLVRFAMERGIPQGAASFMADRLGKGVEAPTPQATGPESELGREFVEDMSRGEPKPSGSNDALMEALRTMRPTTPTAGLTDTRIANLEKAAAAARERIALEEAKKRAANRTASSPPK